jgi:DNA-binding transcriptional LysR family regulator
VELGQVLAFVSVADAGSISGAARGLGYSQPGLSQRVQALERRLGHDLFIRGKRGVTLTTKGSVMLPYARVLMAVEQQLRADLAKMPEQQPPPPDGSDGPDGPDGPDEG